MGGKKETETLSFPRIVLVPAGELLDSEVMPDDGVAIYLRDVGEVGGRLLTAEQERSLGRQKERGRMADLLLRALRGEASQEKDKTLMTYVPQNAAGAFLRFFGLHNVFEPIIRLQNVRTSQKEEKTTKTVVKFALRDGLEKPTLGESSLNLLAELAHSGRQAKDTLTEHNLRLVVNTAKNKIGRDVPLADLIQEGNLGLMRAVAKFDWRKGFRFSTHATWWINQAISRSIADKQSVIRLPVHMREKYGRLIRIEDRLQQELGRDPEVNEVAEAMGLTVQQVVELRRARETVHPISLDQVTAGKDQDAEGNEPTYGDSVADPSVDVEREAILKKLRKELEPILNQLTPRELAIVRYRFGLLLRKEGEQEEGMILKEIGRMLGLTRERVRQILEDVLAKLPALKGMDELKVYWE